MARIILGREAGEAALQALRLELGLDRPLPLQYLSWLGGFLTGDWGGSYSTGQAIRPLVQERLGNSLMLAVSRSPSPSPPRSSWAPWRRFARAVGSTP